MEHLIPQTIVRLLVPLLIFRYPLVGILLAMGIDVIDWLFIDTTNPEVLAVYQNWDKALDVYFQFIIFYIVFRFKDTLARNTAIGLFLLRALGLSLFYATGVREFLFFFPNLFDNFVVLYLIYVTLSKKQILFKTKSFLVLILATLFIPKIFHEYFLHFRHVQPWDVYNVAEYLGVSENLSLYVNALTWGGALYVLPIGITLFLILRRTR